MPLGKEGFDQTRPDEQKSETDDEQNEVGRGGAQAVRESGGVFPAKQCAAEDQAGLAGDEERGNFRRAVRQKPG